VLVFSSEEDGAVGTKKAGLQPAAPRVFEAVFGASPAARGKQAAADLAAWHQVYAGLFAEEIALVEEIALDRSRFSRS
jgi:cell division protein FtsB